MAFQPSPQQAQFLNWVKTGNGSCVLEAVAGAGKTTTILESISFTGGGVAILAYNKKIAEEIKVKLQKRNIDWKTAEAGTVHSFGFRAYRKAFPSARLDEHKLDNLIQEHVTDEALLPFHAMIGRMVSLAKQSAFGIVTPLDDRAEWHRIVEHFDLAFESEGAEEAMEEIISAAVRVLKASNAQTNVIDFDDMVYLPVLHRVKFWGYRWVFVDEAQDTNAARRALVRALVGKGGRVVAVGDRHQAIYGFTGADADSLDLIKKDFNARDLPLTTTYRCPQAVVKFAQQWVNHIEAHSSAPEGSVEAIDLKTFF